MASLTIRNISVTPLELTQVERFGAEAIEDTRGVTEHVWNLVCLPYNYIMGRNGHPASGSGGTGLAPKHGAQATTTDQIGNVQIAPFSTTQTQVKAPQAGSEVLRLTFKATFDNGANVRLYTVDVPSASSRSNELRPVGGDAPQAGSAAASAAFSAVYSANGGATLAVLSSAALSRWMGTVDGAWPLSSLSLPGTHNSPACHYALPSVRCQAVGVRAQLDNGVRFLDVRVSVNPPKQPHADPRIALVHSVFPVGLLGSHHFGELYDAVCGFLDANPSETVLISIKKEGTGKGSDADLAHQLVNHYTGGPADVGQARPQGQAAARQPGQAEPWRWYTESRIPSLDEVRGRIVLVRRFHTPDEDVFKQMHGGAGWGLDGSSWPDNCEDGTCGSGPIRLQDFYEVLQTPAIDTKIKYVHGLLAKSGLETYTKLGGLQARSQENAPPVPPLFINFLTASNFFNARCWPENVAARVNPSVVEYLCVRHGEADGQNGKAGDCSTGILVTDWVGHHGDWDLLRCIVAWNARLQLKN
ncbi:1-phosphatidylinositol phosphodiesterase [Sporothrix schenckii 1099-18]|uniref:Phosphatidylinositol-specific phospholipase C X domain-containing protein n=2 Tax=Sporothrix schenckii TaxID=29908 RepID=U7PNJ8_SPOS1|nr:1-phosphatidylinositol phosphodiesterase [Sporothrix schenckii 1099-18]ERS96065.1 hypothetical protein HMPREF1624_07601 [Sporothrix schenckii ATCC 58251]KJR81665.1 1-phosphatidylinositol phosphodiesterase [Sporothrix schenckii 1099-18]